MCFHPTMYVYKNVKNVISTWEGGRFHTVFGDRPTKWPIAKNQNQNQNMYALGCTTTN